MAKKTRWVAYADLGQGSGAEVNPDDFGGLGSENWQYMVDHRTVVPMGDPDAPAPPDFDGDDVDEFSDEDQKALDALLAKKKASDAAESDKDDAAAKAAGQTSTATSSADQQKQEEAAKPGGTPVSTPAPASKSATTSTTASGSSPTPKSAS